MCWLIGSAVISGFPTYQETVDNWPSIEEGKGRAIFYYPKQEGSGLIGPAQGAITIDQDKNLYAHFCDRTFIFADLSEGSHAIEIIHSAFRKNTIKDIQIRAGETQCFKFYKDKYRSSSSQFQEASFHLLPKKTIVKAWDMAEPGA